MMQLRPDNVSEWDSYLFERLDATPDEAFYGQPRKVVHIDEPAIAAVTDLYRTLLPAGGAILDLMSSWRSHLPSDVSYSRVVGLGMNGAEMADNSQLNEFIVHNLNEAPTLPFVAAEFDGACCCVSVQYMRHPVEIFREVARVLRPNSPFVVTFSNRCFPTKAVNLWRYTDDDQHKQIVALYFAAANGWRDITMRNASPGPASDPLYGVWAYTVEI